MCVNHVIKSILFESFYVIFIRSYVSSTRIVRQRTLTNSISVAFRIVTNNFDGLKCINTLENSTLTHIPTLRRQPSVFEYTHFEPYNKHTKIIHPITNPLPRANANESFNEPRFIPSSFNPTSTITYLSLLDLPLLSIS